MPNDEVRSDPMPEIAGRIIQRRPATQAGRLGNDDVESGRQIEVHRSQSACSPVREVEVKLLDIWITDQFAA